MTTAILSLVLLAAGPPDSSATRRLPAPVCKVILVPDGDSVVLLAQGQTVRVGLLGVLPPTDDYRVGRRGPRAEFLRGLVMGQEVRVEYEPGPRSEGTGSEPAHLYRVSDGRWINLAMIRAGDGRAASAYGFEGQFLSHRGGAARRELGACGHRGRLRRRSTRSGW